MKQGKYIVICYCFNFLVMTLFIALNSSSGSAPTSGGPYLVWTGVFSAIGAKILKKKGLNSEIEQIEAAESAASESENAEQGEYVASNDDPTLMQDAETESVDTIYPARFCRHCGVEIAPDAEFCHRCGTKVIHVQLAE